MSAYDDLTKLENSRNCLRRIARHDEPQCSKDSIINMMEKFVKTVKMMDETILIPCRLMDRQVGDSTDIIPAPGKNSTSNQLTLNSSVQGKRGIEKSKNVHEFLNSSELFNLYNVLNTLKNELLWTGKDENVDDLEDFDTGIYDGVNRLTVTTTTTTASAPPPTETETVSSVTIVPTTTTATTAITTAKGHVRRPSTASVASTVSVSNLSDSDSEISNENDSGMESESNKSDNPQSSSGSISSSENVCTQKKVANIDKATDLSKRCKRHLNGLYQCLEQMTEAANYLTARYQSDIGPV